MRLVRPILGGFVIGALAGLVFFLVILFLPSKTPDNADGAGSYAVLLFIAAVFATMGGIVGGFLGLWLGGMYHVAMGTLSQRRRSSDLDGKPGRSRWPLDDLD
jgi:MFS family permease